MRKRDALRCLLFLLLPFALMASSFAQDWSELHDELFSQDLSGSKLQHVEKKVQSKFEESKEVQVKARLALVLVKIQSEKKKGSSQWASWILGQKNARQFLSQEELCYVQREFSVSLFLQRNWEAADATLTQLMNDNGCDWSTRDFAAFQLGWVFVNDGQTRKATRLWQESLEGFRARQALQLMPLLKTLSSMLLEQRESPQSVLSRVQWKDLAGKEKDAVMDGFMDFLAQSYPDSASSSKAQDELEDYARLFPKEELQKAFARSKLSWIMQACYALGWIPTSGENALREEKWSSCATQIASASGQEKVKHARRLAELSTVGCPSCQTSKVALLLDSSLKTQACLSALNSKEKIEESLLQRACAHGESSELLAKNIERFALEELHEEHYSAGLLWALVLRIAETPQALKLLESQISSKRLPDLRLAFLEHEIQNERLHPKLLKLLKTQELTEEKQAALHALRVDYHQRGALDTQELLAQTKSSDLQGSSAHQLALLKVAFDEQRISASELLQSSQDDAFIEGCEEACQLYLLAFSFRHASLNQTWVLFGRMASLRASPMPQKAKEFFTHMSLEKLLHGKGALSEESVTSRSVFLTQTRNSIEKILSGDFSSASVLMSNLPAEKRKQLMRDQKNFTQLERFARQAKSTFAARSSVSRIENYIRKGRSIAATNIRLMSRNDALALLWKKRYQSLLEHTLERIQRDSVQWKLRAFWKSNEALLEKLEGLIASWQKKASERAAS